MKGVGPETPAARPYPKSWQVNIPRNSVRISLDIV